MPWCQCYDKNLEKLLVLETLDLSFKFISLLHGKRETNLLVCLEKQKIKMLPNKNSILWSPIYIHTLKYYSCSCAIVILKFPRVNLHLKFNFVMYCQYLWFSTATRKLELKKAYKGKFTSRTPSFLLLIYVKFCRRLVLSWMSDLLLNLAVVLTSGRAILSCCTSLQAASVTTSTQGRLYLSGVSRWRQVCASGTVVKKCRLAFYFS